MYYLILSSLLLVLWFLLVCMIASVYDRHDTQRQALRQVAHGYYLRLNRAQQEAKDYRLLVDQETKRADDLHKKLVIELNKQLFHNKDKYWRQAQEQLIHKVLADVETSISDYLDKPYEQ